MITSDTQLMKEIVEELQSNWFAKRSETAYKTALDILAGVNSRKELKPFLKDYLTIDLNVWNLIAHASRRIKAIEPPRFTVGEHIFSPTKVYKLGWEPAVVREVNGHQVLVKPTRQHAAEHWFDQDVLRTESELPLKKLSDADLFWDGEDFIA